MENICKLAHVLREPIYSISYSKEKNQIYICVLLERKVKIFDYNLLEKKVKLNIREIFDDNDKIIHFNKCISISNKYLATSDNDCINIWNEDINNKSNYLNIKKIILNEKTCDLLSINNDYFISSHPETSSIAFYKVSNFTREKEILNIECINYKDCFLLFKQYTIVNCCKGISILLNQTRELVQIIDSNCFFNDKKIIISCNESIYIAITDGKNKYNYRYTLKISRYKIIEGYFDKIGEYEQLIFDNKEDEENERIEMFCVNEKDFIISGEKELLLKGEEMNDEYECE